MPDPAALPTISADRLGRRLAEGTASIVDLRVSAGWLAGHVPGSIWSIRPRIADALGRCGSAVTLIADDPRLAAWAVSDLAPTERRVFTVLDGGFAAWEARGGEVRRAPEALTPADRIDFLFFVHDRHAGNKAASSAYLEWEMGLLAQLDEQERGAFRPMAP